MQPISDNHSQSIIWIGCFFRLFWNSYQSHHHAFENYHVAFTMGANPTG